MASKEQETVRRKKKLDTDFARLVKRRDQLRSRHDLLRHKVKERFMRLAEHAIKKLPSYKRNFRALEEAEGALNRLSDERVLLESHCPRRHDKPTMGYYRCDLCGFLWDDEPPKHF